MVKVWDSWGLPQYGMRKKQNFLGILEHVDENVLEGRKLANEENIV